METKDVIELLEKTLRGHLQEPQGLSPAEEAARALLPEEQMRHIDHVLTQKAISYRDALVIQLAYALCAAARLDLTVRHKGARGSAGVAGRFASLLAESHIPHVKDAYQNVGKNTAKLTRGNVPEFDAFLRWASQKGRSKEELEAAFQYVCARIAATARPITTMPSLNLSALEFGTVMGLLVEMFRRGSQGAYEQFAVAALLDALVQQTGAQGYRVETKSLNASDRSSRVAGDIQILTGNRIIEAYEVTAADWSSKVGGAEQAIRDNDLSRLHIVANTAQEDHGEILRQLRALRSDVSVLDLQGFVASITATLTRQYRAVALNRLYDFLDRYQPDVGKVNGYVSLLESHGVVVP